MHVWQWINALRHTARLTAFGLKNLGMEDDATAGLLAPMVFDWYCDFAMFGHSGCRVQFDNLILDVSVNHGEYADEMSPAWDA